MDIISSTLLPADVGPLFALVLIIGSLFTSAITAAFGLGGGIAMMALLAGALPLAVVVPVHGVIQLGSNSGRAIVQRRHIVWRIVLWLGVGAVFGAWIGGYAVAGLPDRPLKLALALFVLWSVWGAKPKFQRLPAYAIGVAGVASAAVSMVFGATGPLVAALLNPLIKDRFGLVATHAASMVLQHLLKIAVFGLLGFDFLPWLPLIAAMVATGFIGTLAGTHLLRRMPETMFRIGFKTVMTLLALDIAYQALA